jgi:hypothetical protein
MNKKLGRNDICLCGSGKKFKKCCINVEPITKFNTGQEKSSEKINFIKQRFQSNFPNHKVIDITDDLYDGNYKEYQLKNFNKNIIMVAEKNGFNSLVFAERVNNPLSDIIVMYHGAYRTFQFDNFEFVYDSITTLF